MELMSRKAIAELEGREPDDEMIAGYVDPDSDNYKKMVEKIREKLNFTSLEFLRLDDMISSTGLDAENLCTYCWNGKD